MAVVSFGVADMAIGLGEATVVLGLIIGGLAVPVHLLVMRTRRLAA